MQFSVVICVMMRAATGRQRVVACAVVLLAAVSNNPPSALKLNQLNVRMFGFMIVLLVLLCDNVAKLF
ncbi:MAG TPA: hypothetical protein VK524_31570 [Polyangiaceae bacterium]|nr:hypothetical protein [Polyangiaceae bacterium]